MKMKLGDDIEDIKQERSRTEWLPRSRRNRSGEGARSGKDKFGKDKFDKDSFSKDKSVKGKSDKKKQNRAYDRREADMNSRYAALRIKTKKQK